jgi:glycerol-3-phosphate acyltransferase PlsY
MTNFILLIIFGYLLGSFPTGFLLCKARGINVQKIGSGATGGTNVSRALGWGWGAFVGIVDILKGLIPIYLAMNFSLLDWQIALVAVLPVLGHIFPVWLKFKGGKGVATSFGTLFLIIEYEGILALILIFLFFLVIFRIVSFASLSMSASIPLVAFFLTGSSTFCILGIVLAVIIWWAHRENIQRLKEGKEPKFKLRRTTQ